MSNSQLPPTIYKGFPEDCLALARIGKTFRLIDYVFFIMCLVLFFYIMAAEIVFSNFDLSILSKLCKIFLFDCCWFILIAASINFWGTPESLVPGGKIVRYSIVVFIINTIFAQFYYAIYGRYLLLILVFPIFCVGVIPFLIYLWRLAAVFDSEGIKRSIKKGVILTSILVSISFFIYLITILVLFTTTNVETCESIMRVLRWGFAIPCATAIILAKELCRRIYKELPMCIEKYNLKIIIPTNLQEAETPVQE